MVEALVGAEHDVVRWALVICHYQDRVRVAKLPQVRILVHLFPGEAGVATEERVALVVLFEGLTNVSDSHQETGDRWRAIRGAYVVPFCVAVDVKGALLLTVL